MEKYLLQMFILGTQNPYSLLSKGLGGVIFFSKDIPSERYFKNLIDNIKKHSLIPPFLSIDQEGGRVERTENIRPKRLSARYAFHKGEDFLKQQSEELAKELADYGINLNFAPCVDVNTNPNNPIIGERSFSNNPDDVIKGMNIFIKASERNGIIPCIKHFPGHGDADKDSHLTLPQINLSLEEMEQIHLKPFRFAINNNIDMIMIAHLYCSCFDKNVIPTSLSKNAITYLRRNLNYDGVIITDDMVMEGVRKFGSTKACLMAIDAGVNMFIFRNSDEETLNMITEVLQNVENDKNLQDKVMQSYNKIISLKEKYNFNH